MAVVGEVLVRRGWFNPPPGELDGYREYSLRLVIRRMSRRRRKFDPDLKVIGADVIRPGGALFITGHFFLNPVFMRWLFDRGWPVSLVTTGHGTKLNVSGTHAPVDLIVADKMVFLHIRQRIAAGHAVLLMVDEPGPSESNGWLTLKAPSGPRRISDASIRFAERAGIPLLFCLTRVTADHEVMTKVVRPSGEGTAAILEEFVSFLTSEVKQIAY